MALSTASSVRAANAAARQRGASQKRLSGRGRCPARATASGQTDTGVSTTDSGGEEFYEVNMEKPIQLKFCRGNDGGAYIKGIGRDPRFDMEQFSVGDKVVNISASFGEEVWEAENYGQTMFAMKTRSGTVYMRFRKCNGDLTPIETFTDDAYMSERNSGNYGASTKIRQEKNYIRLKELAIQRGEMFEEGVKLFYAGEYQRSLEVFEDCIGLEPPNYMGDDFSRYTPEYRLSHYNVACCCSKLDQTEAGLEALMEAMEAGFEDFRKIRTDPNLEGVRANPKFDKLIVKYDEPVINENAMKMFKSIFGGGK